MSKGIPTEAGQFVEKVTQQKFEEATDHLEDEYTDEITEVIPTLSGETAFEKPEIALQRFWRILTHKYGTFEERSHESEWSEDSQTVEIELTFTQGKQSLSLEINDAGEISGLDLGSYTPPSYVDEDAFAEREITVAVDGAELEATVTLPQEQASAPGVMLVKGSGQIDRNYQMGPNRPYQDLALGLASQGIAVLRYEERTMIPGDDEILGVSTIIDDALEALDRFAAVDTVDSNHCFIAGWSAGGMFLPEVASRHEKLAGVILLDAPTETGHENRGKHYRGNLEFDGLTEKEQNALKQTAEEFDQIGEKEEGSIGGMPVEIMDEMLQLEYQQTLRELSTPKYLIGTGRQFDTAFETSYEDWREYLEGTDTTFNFYPAMHHAFQRGVDNAIGESSFIPDDVDRELVDDLAAWIQTRTT